MPRHHNDMEVWTKNRLCFSRARHEWLIYPDNQLMFSIYRDMFYDSMKEFLTLLLFFWWTMIETRRFQRCSYVHEHTVLIWVWSWWSYDDPVLPLMDDTVWLLKCSDNKRSVSEFLESIRILCFSGALEGVKEIVHIKYNDIKNIILSIIFPTFLPLFPCILLYCIYDSDTPRKKSISKGFLLPSYRLGDLPRVSPWMRTQNPRYRSSTAVRLGETTFRWCVWYREIWAYRCRTRYRPYSKSDRTQAWIYRLDTILTIGWCYPTGLEATLAHRSLPGDVICTPRCERRAKHKPIISLLMEWSSQAREKEIFLTGFSRRACHIRGICRGISRDTRETLVQKRLRQILPKNGRHR